MMITSVNLQDAPTPFNFLLACIGIGAVLVVFIFVIEALLSHEDNKREWFESDGVNSTGPYRYFTINPGNRKFMVGLFIITIIIGVVMHAYGAKRINQEFVQEQYGVTRKVPLPGARSKSPKVMLDTKFKDGTLLPEVFVYREGDVVTLKRLAIKSEIEKDSSLNYGDLIDIDTQ